MSATPISSIWFKVPSVALRHAAFVASGLETKSVERSQVDQVPKRSAEDVFYLDIRSASCGAFLKLRPAAVDRDPPGHDIRAEAGS
jgi:hypothetical protein